MICYPTHGETMNPTDPITITTTTFTAGNKLPTIGVILEPTVVLTDVNFQILSTEDLDDPKPIIVEQS